MIPFPPNSHSYFVKGRLNWLFSFIWVVTLWLILHPCFSSPLSALAKLLERHNVSTYNLFYSCLINCKWAPCGLHKCSISESSMLLFATPFSPIYLQNQLWLSSAAAAPVSSGYLDISLYIYNPHSYLLSSLILRGNPSIMLFKWMIRASKLITPVLLLALHLLPFGCSFITSNFPPCY